jgi:cytochrome c-type biogenesis protein CcmH
MIWALLAALAVAVVAALLWPLVREATAGADERREIAVLKDQLAEVERDRGRGTISDAEAEAMTLEIQRRILAASRRPPLAAWREGPALRVALAAGLAVSVPMAAFAVYLNLGAPLLQPQTPAADPEMVKLVEQLAARMQAEPGNVQGWMLLARSYRKIERFDAALAAYRHVLTFNPDDADPYASFGEMAVTLAGGEVGAEAQAAFRTALTKDRNEPRARFYLGLAAAQAGDAQRAIAIWRELTAGAPPDAPWLEMVRGQMFQLAQQAAIMPMNVAPRHPLDETPAPPPVAAAPAPAVAEMPPSDPDDITAPDVSAIRGQFSGENLAQIQAMVGSLAGRLENQPDDYNGWMMLGRSYTVLRNAEGAKRAFAKAMALKPGELQPRLNYVAVLLDETNLDAPGPLPQEVITAAAEILTLSPSQPEGLFVRGLAAYKAGDTAAARKDWIAAKARAQGALAAELDRRLRTLSP